MSGAVIQVVIFGASGDLTRRKLIPALVGLHRRGELDPSVSVIGVARRSLTEDAFRAQLREALEPDMRAAFDQLAARIHYQSADVTDTLELAALGQRLDAMAGGRPTGRLLYLSLKPELFASSVDQLGQAGILAIDDEDPGHWRRVVVEKPFGSDRQSAHELNAHLHRHLREDQIYRIDHYLGKETVQNLLGFRFHNTIFEPLWNRHHVELVQITVAEEVGVEKGRAGYYDTTGALRDVMQNHMLQLLALVAMEPPVSLEGEAVRGQKVEVLRALHCPDSIDIARQSVRARYAAGELGGGQVIGYLDEEGVPADSSTETFVALRAEINTWRWNGVPFLLRHGKRMKKRFTEIQVQFRNAPVQLFNRPQGLTDAEFRRMLREGSLCQIRPNVLTISIQPREAITLSFGVKEPGGEMVMTPAHLSFDYQDRFGDLTAPAYERLLADAIEGDPTLFLRSDEIDSSWRYVDEVLSCWREPNAPPLLEYPAGSWGPVEAERLFAGCEGGWSRG